MTNSLIKSDSRHIAILLTAGLIMCIETLFTLEWSSPYCMSQEDGPAYAAFGLPLPYIQFGGASSLEYDFMLHIYLFNLIILYALIFPAVRWTLDRSSRNFPTRLPFVAGVVGFVLLSGRIALLVFSITVQATNPTSSIGSETEPYESFRPVGFSRHDGHYECKPSAYWFPNGWTHD